ncbi:MAG: two-component system sensor histidine kinase NtrB [Gemmatimonadaceae bacterium]
MPSALRRQSPRPSRSTSSALATLAEVAALLAGSDAPGDVLPGVLQRIGEALDAPGVTLWLQSPRGLVRAAATPDDTTAEQDVVALLVERDDAGGVVEQGGLAAARLVSGRRRLGVLSARPRAALSPAGSQLLSAVANVLAPVLSMAEQSHRLESEVALRIRQIDEQRRFIEKVVDSLPVGLHVIDREYRIQAWNRKRETGMQGVSREEAIGRTIFEILHRQPAELLRDEFDDVFASGRIRQFEMESTATGDVRTYRISKIPMRLDESAITHVITIGEDVTEWKEAQERFAQAEKLAAVGQLAAGVMHEINNPLATIAACAESMALKLEDLGATASPAAAGYPDYLKIIDDEVHRCKRIVDGLLDFSRPRPAIKEPVDLNQVVGQTLFLLKHHSRFKHLDVHTSLDPEVATPQPGGRAVQGNPEQLVQVFMALLINAMDAMDGVAERPSVTVRTRRGRAASEAVVAEVVDRGIGIARADVPKIFEPFYTTKAPGRGTGLGLSICYAIIADHGGRIEVDSAPGKGSIFRVVLPAAPLGDA